MKSKYDTCPDNRHWCSQHKPADGWGMGPGYFCAAKDHAVTATELVDPPTCTRRIDHDGPHKGFRFGITEPHTWPVAP